MKLKSITLGRIIRWFKGRVKFETKKISPDFHWQSRFHDRFIRDEKEFYFISEYIINNPINWGEGVLKKYFESVGIRFIKFYNKLLWSQCDIRYGKNRNAISRYILLFSRSEF
ncbi:MAG: hypothetical protein A2057_13745 [Ignavibacteria bacterium GWA2_35_9]|nr:MAG: hypothetical protein A2057_13745 [Ignavibacteria bacterium GWA2_35_9]OGU51288.1 MAG: hypothetical protein A2080_04670 [Ignavibacteria bacterium GWC2_36_12]OGV02303.1 MAG: hypothetical protein A2330_11525 [Ignavibacteria bacterium RIFOXYB2_FULL_36_7]